MSDEIGWGDSWIEAVRRHPRGELSPADVALLRDLYRREQEERIRQLQESYDNWLAQVSAEQRFREEEIERQERREAEVIMTAPAPETVLLETGERRDGVNSSCRIFFVYVTPTGAEMPITRCPALSKVVTRASGGFEGSTRLVTSEYRVMTPTTLKMVNIVSRFGAPKTVINLFIHLSPEEPMFSIYGLEKFGRFRGRGKVDFKESIYRTPTKVVPVTMARLKEEFGMTLVTPGKKAAGGRARSLMFD